MDNITKNIILTPMNLLYKISPRLCLQILFRLKTGYKLNLDNPTTYNEKLQWIKLYDRNELMPICCDKYTVREYVKSCGCEEILNELLWEGFNPRDIPFDDLPNQFVIKATHGSGFNIICTNRNELDYDESIKKLEKWLNTKFIPCYGEWFYCIERPRIIIEEYLEDEKAKSLFDYKIFCFHGEPKSIYVDTWKNGEHTINAYDIDFNLFKDVQLGYKNDFETTVEKPKNYDKMLDYAKRLSKPFIHVRVDFYNINGKIVFGELTFTKGAGFGKIKPHTFDKKMGSWIKLPIGGWTG